jgi:hypothetical protein
MRCGGLARRMVSGRSGPWRGRTGSHRAGRPHRTLRGWKETLALRLLTGGLACTTNGFRLLAGLALGGLLESLALLHFAEDALALHLLLQNPESLVNVVVADKNLHVIDPICFRCKRQAGKGKSRCGLASGAAESHL